MQASNPMSNASAIAASDWIAIAAAAISLLSLAATAFFSWLLFRQGRFSGRLQYLSTKDTYFADLRQWANQLTDLLSEAVHLCDLDPARCAPPSFFDRRHQLRIALSSLIDRGRWFFPNLHSEAVGTHKPAAFRGYREEVLNSLVEAYRLLGRLDYSVKAKNDPFREPLVDSKKKFVSEIQVVFNPRERAKEFREITTAAN